MGASKSKEEKELEEELDRVYEPYLIQWDDNGHLRYGRAPQTVLIVSNYYPHSFHHCGLTD